MGVGGAPVKHHQTGLYARGAPALKRRDMKVRYLMRKLKTACPWFQPGDYPALRAWCELEVLCGRVYSVLREIGVISPVSTKDNDVSPRRLLDEYRKLRQAQATWAAALGLTPAARAALRASGTNAALDAAAIAEPISERVIEVGKSRGRVAEVEDGDGDGINPRSE